MGEHKDLQETVLFDFKKEDCDVTITSKNKLILVTSAFLKYVLGDSFQEIVLPSSKAVQHTESTFEEEKGTAHGEEDKNFQNSQEMQSYVIKMDEIGAERIVYALSFYQPMYFKEQKVNSKCSSFANQGCGVKRGKFLMANLLIIKEKRS